MLKNNPENFEGGKIKLHLDSWISLLKPDKWILEHVKGVQISKGHTFEVPDKKEINFPSSIKTIIHKEISSLLEKQVIEPVDDIEGQIISNVFVREKRDGSHRVILNLREFNKCLDKIHFKMESLKNAINLMTQDCYFASIDLKDAYFSVNIHENSRRLFRFKFQGVLYQFRGLPQGFKDSPRIFTKLCKPILGFLRRKGHSLVGYIDDFFIKANTKKECFRSLKEAGHTFDDLGFTIHPKKSVTEPDQKIEFLGFILDSVKMQVSVGDNKASEVTNKIRQFLDKDEVSIRDLASIVGTLVALNSGVWIGPVFWRRLEIEKALWLKMYKGDFEQLIFISETVKEDLCWWISNIQAFPTKVVASVPSVTLTTDASQEGWGAVKDNTVAGGDWSVEEKQNHINVLELLAVLLGLKSLCVDVKNTTIKIRTDNSTTMACINRMGSAKEGCNNITRLIWLWCLERDNKLIAVHVPGKLNVDADRESRRKRYPEWVLNTEVFDDLNLVRGPFSVDLFASRNAHKLDKYVSWKADPEAWQIDAMSLEWNFDGIYCFPPFCMISFILARVCQQKATMTLVAPRWPRQVWFPTLMDMLVEEPVELPNKNIVSDPATGKIMNNAVLKLTAYSISGDLSKQMEFRKRQERSFARAGARTL